MEIWKDTALIKGKVTYSSNNSGGGWWLNDDNWLALEDAGWEVEWVKDQEERLGGFRGDKNGRWLGALATKAKKLDTTMRQAIAEWEDVTGQDSSDLGCSCCGTPHSFEFDGDDGSHEYYYPDYPESGSRYY